MDSNKALVKKGKGSWRGKEKIRGGRERVRRGIGATVALLLFLACRNALVKKGEGRGGNAEGDGWRGIGATVVSRGAANPVITVTNPGPPMVVDNRIN